MFHKYLSDIIKKERVWFPNWYRKEHLDYMLEESGEKVSTERWDEFIAWWDSNGDHMDMSQELHYMWLWFKQREEEDEL